MAEEIPGLPLKATSYTYGGRDEIVQIAYQHDGEDAFYHYFQYDADSRLKKVFAGPEEFLNQRTKKPLNSMLLRLPQYLQAEYSYYKHGPLKQLALSPRKNDSDSVIALQYLDYIYTIDGRLKAINDPHQYEDRKEFALQLDYYSQDGKGTELIFTKNIEPKYDGQIAAGLWRTGPAQTDGFITMAYGYEYDERGQLHRAKYGTVENNEYIHDPNDALATEYVYDDNGNIEILERKDDEGKILQTEKKDVNGNTEYIYDHIFDYNYHEGTNKLWQVWTNEMQYAEYRYNNIGQLVWADILGEVMQLEYNNEGMVSKILNEDGMLQWKYDYNAIGQRSKKTSFNLVGEPSEETYYVRDASGKVLAIYHRSLLLQEQVVFEEKSPELAEIPIYGAARLGTIFVEKQIDGYPEDFIQYNESYELKDHLGNVRTIIRRDDEQQALAIGYSDYYPFGLRMNRYTNANYRYGYQGEFSEDETQEIGYNVFEARLYDPVIGRWISVDSERQHSSPFISMSNIPNLYIDPDGFRDWVAFGEGALGLIGAGFEVAAGFSTASAGVGGFLIVDGGVRGMAAMRKMYVAYNETSDYSYEARDLPTNSGGLIGKAIDKRLGDDRGIAQKTLGITNDAITLFVSITDPGFSESVKNTVAGTASRLEKGSLFFHYAGLYEGTLSNAGAIDKFFPPQGEIIVGEILIGDDFDNFINGLESLK
ncbi:RHS repeat-associated core domain-containing protein [Persicobacter diffluens]|uniref:RHS repeat-associated core domain-containing protein n=1 Tax=Persicobacter diffluens TaxID=981 RepID=A0AAN4W4D8_9BACT|nr:hypothetical protein PEDI_54640 [Persicobacter diffluens]